MSDATDTGAMQRLDFRLPEFVRVSWTSDMAREVWQPRLARIVRAWRDLEVRSVVAGARPCCLVMTSPTHLTAHATQWLRLGLAGLPVAMFGASATYEARTTKPEPGAPVQYRVAVGRLPDLAQFGDAYAASNNDEIGRLLGYPNCCSVFFQQQWVQARFSDPTWPMALASGSRRATQRTAVVDALPEANVLWRWLGIRAVPHLPCSFCCAATQALGRRIVEVGRACGYREEMDWLLDLLSWPLEWSALHGIAEIKTPILKVSTTTDATAEKYVVRLAGAKYPAEGARGNEFPYRRTGDRTRTARHGQDATVVAVSAEAADAIIPAWYASDNGFRSRAAMDEAHAPVLQAAAAAIHQRDAKHCRVLDLGCGNGALLKKIVEACPGAIPAGIDLRESCIMHARELLPEFAANFLVGDLFDGAALWHRDERYNLVLLMVGRLREVSASRTDALKHRLGAHNVRLLIYAYRDTLAKYGLDLRQLAAATGLTTLEWRPGATVGFAEFG